MAEKQHSTRADKHSSVTQVRCLPNESAVENTHHTRALMHQMITSKCDLQLPGNSIVVAFLKTYRHAHCRGYPGKMYAGNMG